MKGLFAQEGKSCISISIDDFYATGMEQETIAKMNPNNPLLQFRGNGESDHTQILMISHNIIS